MSNCKATRLLFLLFTPVIFALLFSCGGDDASSESVSQDSDDNKVADVSPSEEGLPEVQDTEPEELELPEVVEVKKQPNPNGVYLLTGEEKNGKPVYANQEAFHDVVRRSKLEDY